ncbi:hypothetical protein ACJ6WF_33000 [Streptomyces sp. MMS24-I2-30]|uniref:hypothetical protein n=1 Tax=Streptomyces sp. MMS24-I2-30 TaxID=3351564 RepID=UPI003896E92B
MPESLPVRCPVCRREHVYTAPAYPCACGVPVTPALNPGAEPVVIAHLAWDDHWVTVHCPACGRRDDWPHPELGCPCGTALRVPVTGSTAAADGTDPRAAFRPVTIRSARDAVTAAALHLRRLGYRDIRRADQRPTSGIGLAARGLPAQVDPTTGPASLRDVERLWLTAMPESAQCVYFSLCGYADDVRDRADTLDIPLFVLDPTGTPQPVNAPAARLDGRGP